MTVESFLSLTDDLRRLRVDRAHGTPAPHKAILLMALARLYARNPTRGSRVDLDDVARDYEFLWKGLTRGRADDGVLPFMHLVTAPFWRLSRSDRLEGGRRVRTRTQMSREQVYAELSEPLHEALSDRRARALVVLTLLHAWIPEAAQTQVLRLLDADLPPRGRFGAVSRRATPKQGRRQP